MLQRNFNDLMRHFTGWPWSFFSNQKSIESEIERRRGNDTFSFSCWCNWMSEFREEQCLDLPVKSERIVRPKEDNWKIYWGLFSNGSILPRSRVIHELLHFHHLPWQWLSHKWWAFVKCEDRESDEHLFHSASFEDRRDRQRKDERNKGDLTLSGVRFNLIFWIKFSTSVEAIELRMMAPIPEVGVCTSTYFYGLRFSWACGRKKKKTEKNKERPKNTGKASGGTNTVLAYCRS